mmetsp:Transcript_32436/g.75750  ORF Transcript_32436/g.75750 Transcript_32436/m.75750 type:complete len:357 (-) Transcript_32436:17-1087(-)
MSVDAARARGRVPAMNASPGSDSGSQLRKLHRIANALHAGRGGRATGGAETASRELRALALSAGVIDASQLTVLGTLGTGGYARVELCELRPLPLHALKPPTLLAVPRAFNTSTSSSITTITTVSSIDITTVSSPPRRASWLTSPHPSPSSLAHRHRRAPLTGGAEPASPREGDPSVPLVAVKRLRPLASSGASARRKNAKAASDLLAEAVLLANLHHPNIVLLLGVTSLPPLTAEPPRLGRSKSDGNLHHTLGRKSGLIISVLSGNGSAYTAPVASELALMEEYLSGGPLTDRIRRADYSALDALQWTLDVAHALAFMHDGGGGGLPVAHRDVKPENSKKKKKNSIQVTRRIVIN